MKQLDLEAILVNSTKSTFKSNLRTELEPLVKKKELTTVYQQVAQFLYQQEQFDYAIKSWELGIESVDHCTNDQEKFELFKQYGLALNSYKGDYYGAISYLTKAQMILTEVNTEELLEILFGLSRAYFNLNQLQKSQKIAEKILELSLTSDNFNQVRAYLNLGDISLEMNQLLQARKYYKNGLSQAQNDEEIVLRSILLMNIGTLYKREFLYDNALDYYNQAKEIYEKIEFNYELAELYINIAPVLSKKMQFDDAILYLKNANEYFLKIGHTNNILTSYINLGRVEQDRANYKNAIHYFNEAQKICKDNSNFISSYILILYLMGNSFFDLKEIKKADKLYKNALYLATEVEDISQITSIKNALAGIKIHYKKFDEALAIYQENLIVFADLGDIEELIATYTNLALLYDEMGYFQQSHQTYNKALELIKPYNLIYLEISTLINQAELYQNFLKYNDALEQYNYILTQLEYIDNDYFFIKVYHNMANIHEITMRFDEAIEYTNLSIELKKKIGDKQFGSSYGILARSYEGLENFEKSEEYYQLSFENSELDYYTYGMYVNYALFLLNSYKNYEKAIDYLIQAKKFFEIESATEPLIAIHDNLAKVYVQKNNLKKAIFHYKKSLQLGEDILLDRINIEILHLNHRKNFQYTYKKLIKLLLEIKNYNGAYFYIERFKSQTFRKIFSSKYFHSNKIPLTLLEEERSLLNKLTNNSKNNINFGQLIDNNNILKRKLNNVYQKIKPYDESYVFMKLDGVITTDEVKKML